MNLHISMQGFRNGPANESALHHGKRFISLIYIFAFKDVWRAKPDNSYKPRLSFNFTSMSVKKVNKWSSDIYMQVKTIFSFSFL